jgi:hypothetical protein
MSIFEAGSFWKNFRHETVAVGRCALALCRGRKRGPWTSHSRLAPELVRLAARHASACSGWPSRHCRGPARNWRLRPAVLQRPSLADLLNRLTGSVLVAFGLRLAVERR